MGRGCGCGSDRDPALRQADDGHDRGGGDDPEFTEVTRAAAAPVIAVLASYGLDDESGFYAALEFWSAMHGFVLLEMTGVMNGIDTDAVFTDMVMRLAAGMQTR